MRSSAFSAVHCASRCVCKFARRNIWLSFLAPHHILSSLPFLRWKLLFSRMNKSTRDYRSYSTCLHSCGHKIEKRPKGEWKKSMKISVEKMSENLMNIDSIKSHFLGIVSIFNGVAPQDSLLHQIELQIKSDIYFHLEHELTRNSRCCNENIYLYIIGIIHSNGIPSLSFLWVFAVRRSLVSACSFCNRMWKSFISSFFFSKARERTIHGTVIRPNAMN